MNRHMGKPSLNVIDNSLFDKLDNRGAYLDNICFLTGLPRDYEAITFYKCFVLKLPKGIDVLGVQEISEGAVLENVRLTTGKFNVNVSYADFRGIHFKNVTFDSKVSFRACDFSDSRFTECSGIVRLDECDVSNAHLIASDGEANCFQLRVFQTLLKGCILENMNIDNIEFEGNELDIEGVILRNCIFFNKNTDEKGFSDAKVELIKNHTQAEGVYVQDVRFRGVKGFYYLGPNSNLDNANFTKLTKIAWETFHFSDMDFSNCSLVGAVFDGCRIRGRLNFSGSNLSNASFLELKFLGEFINFGDCNLRGVKLTLHERVRNIYISLIGADFELSMLREFVRDITDSARQTRAKITFSMNSLSEELLSILDLDTDTMLDRSSGRLKCVFLGAGCELIGTLPVDEDITLPKNFNMSDSVFRNARLVYSYPLIGICFDRASFEKTSLFSNITSDLAGIQECSFADCIFMGFAIKTEQMLNSNFSGSRGSLVLDALEDVGDCQFDNSVLAIDIDINNIRFRNCSFIDSELKLVFTSTSFISFVDILFEGSSFTNANIGRLSHDKIYSFYKIAFRECDFRGAVFNKETCDFKDIVFEDCIYDQYTKMDLTDSQWESMTFVES